MDVRSRTRTAGPRPPLRIHEPRDLDAPRWLINGHPATVDTWTPEEWERLTDRPGDAQECPNGVRCALRIQ